MWSAPWPLTISRFCVRSRRACAQPRQTWHDWVHLILGKSPFQCPEPGAAEFYHRIFGFEPLEPGEPLNDETRLCPMRAGDRSVLLLFKKGTTPDTDATGAIHIAFGIARSDFTSWEHWLAKQGISIELRKTWKYGGQALYFRDPVGHLLEVVTLGVGSIY